MKIKTIEKKCQNYNNASSHQAVNGINISHLNVSESILYHKGLHIRNTI